MTIDPKTTIEGAFEPDVPVPPARPDSNHMDVHLIDSIAWTAVAKWGTQLVSWGSLLIVARLLAPADFGMLGMTTIYLGLIVLLSEFGIGSSIINLRSLTPDQVKELNGLAVLSALVGLGLSFVCARPIAYFFRVPDFPCRGDEHRPVDFRFTCLTQALIQREIGSECWLASSRVRS